MINNLAKLVINNGGSISPLLIPSELTDGTGLCNVSIFIDDNGDILANLRHVHYTLYHSEFDQKFYCKWGTLSYLNPEDDISLKTGNYLCKLDPDTLEVKTHQKIDTSKFDIPPVWEFHGLEDVRIFRWEGQFYVCGVRRDVKSDGEGRMELCKINWTNNECSEQTRDRIIPPEPTYLEKNWMPILDMPFHFVRWANPIEIVKVNLEDKSTEKVTKGTLNMISSEVAIQKNNEYKLPLGLRGSSPVIPLGKNRICITHECDFFHHPGFKKDAEYYHRFVMWNENWDLVHLSKPFKFMAAQIEFACGLAVKGNDLIITYGYQDNAAYALKMPISLLNELEWEGESPVKEKTTWHEPLIYTKQDYDNFKFKFSGLENIEQNYSQCYQDLFVLSCLNGKTNGTYLEIGAGRPFYGNNTALLSQLGWKGVSIDFNQSLVDSWQKERPNDVCLCKNAIDIDYINLCQKNGLSRYIDYLQLDIDPASNTFKVLENIPFDTIEFGVITYEHDYYDKEDEYREKSRELLLNKGYMLIAGNISPDNNSPYEDWWINKKYIKNYNSNILANIDKEVLFVKDYMLNE